jgi:hypothetical protein
MKREKKKTPKDYPQLAFRISAEEKKEIMMQAEEAVLLLNKGRAKSDRVIRKNDVLIDALKRGLAKVGKISKNRG